MRTISACIPRSSPAAYRSAADVSRDFARADWTRSNCRFSRQIKGSRIGAGAKVPHLAYVGDADVGAGSNLGAGTITANYDGFRKNRTTIGENARVGVDTMLIAPVEVGDGAYTGAGAVIKGDVPPGALAVSENDQRNIEGYADRKAAEMQEETP